MTTDDSIQPFRIDIPQAELDDLRERLGRTRWPASLPGDGWDTGVPTTWLRDLASFWQTGYDWRKAEAALNQFPHFTTVIDGQRVHFLHVAVPRSRRAAAGANPRLAGVGGRVHRRDRSADRPERTRREPRRRRVEPRAHRPGLGGAHAPAGLRALRRPGG